MGMQQIAQVLRADRAVQVVPEKMLQSSLRALRYSGHASPCTAAVHVLVVPKEPRVTPIHGSNMI